jgi:hypothetical protein
VCHYENIGDVQFNRKIRGGFFFTNAYIFFGGGFAGVPEGFSRSATFAFSKADLGSALATAAHTLRTTDSTLDGFINGAGDDCHDKFSGGNG